MLVVGDLLRWNRRRYPSETALIDERGELLWEELVDRAWALARALLGAGLVPGDRVGVLTGNGRFSAETYLGVAAAGMCSVLYNWRWTTTELIHGINLTEARLILVEREFAPNLQAAAESGEIEHLERIVTEGEQYEAFLLPGDAPPVAVETDDPNTIIFTGGTTGFSKGVVLSHKNVITNCFNEIIDTDMEHGDRTLIVAPMYHSGSLLCWFLPHVMLGAASVMLRNFDEEQVARAIEEHRVTNGFLVPNMVRRLLISGQLDGRDISSYRRLYVGGATFKMADKHAARTALPQARFYYQYGLTEAAPMVTRLRPENMFSASLDGSIGQEFSMCQVTIQENGEELMPGMVGEICVRGTNVMLGYYNDAAATEEALSGGWLHTGDLASRDADGYFYFHDRAKDMIKTGGENVYSAEVERVLYGHPHVAEAAVIGVPSDSWDEEVRAVVALRPGASVSAEELRGYCREVLAGYKVPKRVAFVDLHDVPVNPSGKIVKTELRERRLWDDGPAGGRAG